MLRKVASMRYIVIIFCCFFSANSSGVNKDWTQKDKDKDLTYTDLPGLTG